jgi:hypothetical protein
VEERVGRNAICIAIVVMGRKLVGIIVYTHLGLFGNADVTNTDVSFNKCVGKDNMHYTGEKLPSSYGKQGS